MTIWQIVFVLWLLLGVVCAVAMWRTKGPAMWTDDSWLDALTPDERAAYEQWRKNSYSGQMAQAGAAVQGCFMAVFESGWALLSRVILAARRAQGRGR